MNDLNVRIEQLPPMRVASFRAVSEHPESDAWEKLQSWAQPRGFLKNPREHSVFGFNSPAPSPGCKEYGYEFWIQVGPEVAAGAPGVGEPSIEIKEVAGGRYAVLTHHGFPNPEVWKQLWDAVQQAGHRWRKTHELERMHDALAPESEMTFDLYLPIEV